MRILAFSDVVKWERYEEFVDKIEPDVVALAGDLTSDGFASFWHEAVELMPEFQKEKRELMEKLGVIQIGKNVYDCTRNKNTREWFNELVSLRGKYKNTEKFMEIRRRIHVNKFYQFLKYAGKKSQVLVVKGDHDKDFKGDYVPERINKIVGCKEISSKVVEVNGYRFIGLGFSETHYLKTLKPTIEKFREKVDIVVTHCEQNRVPLVSLLKPRIIIRGHFGSGKYLVNGIPSVFTNGVKYTVIEIKNRNVLKITQYVTGPKNKLKELIKGSCKPWFSKVSEYEKYKWLKPYHD